MTKILVVEDEASLRQEIVDWLTFEGYEVIGAEDGVAGLQAVFQDHPDLIICDIAMPKLDGYGVLLEVRSHAETVNIPFIFVTAKTSHSEIRKGMNFGADDYITKPFTHSELFQAIHARLDRKVAQELDMRQTMGQIQETLAFEQEHRLLQSKLVSMFSHDFRNQIAVILSSGALIRDYADRLGEERRKQHMNNINASAQLLLYLVDEMVILAKLESSNYTLEPEPLDVTRLAQEVIEEYQELIGETHPIALDSTVDQLVTSDKRLLRQIIFNLVSNALKYSKPTTTVQVSLHGDAEDFRLEVQSSSAMVQSTQVKGSGSGANLGLAITEQIVTFLGGETKMDAHSTIGSSITLTLPYAIPDNQTSSTIL